MDYWGISTLRPLWIMLLWWVKNLPAMQEAQEMQFNPWVGKIPWRRKWQPTPVFLPEKSHGQRRLAGYSPWDCRGSDTPERLSTHEHSHTSVWGHMFLVLPSICLIVELLANRVTLFNFLKDCKTIFLRGCIIYFPTSNVWGFQFLHILAYICYCPSLDRRHTSGHEVISHCGLAMHFSDD